MIYDFGPKYDSLGFEDGMFTNRTIATFIKAKHGATLDHKVKMDRKFIAFGDHALDRDDFFVYNRASGKLYWDVDGSKRQRPGRDRHDQAREERRPHHRQRLLLRLSHTQGAGNFSAPKPDLETLPISGSCVKSKSENSGSFQFETSSVSSHTPRSRGKSSTPVARLPGFLFCPSRTCIRSRRSAMVLR